MSTKIIVGIDPGARGAIAILEGDSLKVFDLKSCTRPTGTFNSLDTLLFWNIVYFHIPKDDVAIFCEESLLMPGNGIKTARPIYDSRGTMRAVLELHGCKINYVDPKDWKRKLGLLKADKKASVEKAIEAFPDHKALFTKQWHGGTVLLDGRAEAALIALYGSLIIRTP